MGAVDLNIPVLIVDDYKTMLRTMGILLKRLGFENTSTKPATVTRRSRSSWTGPTAWLSRAGTCSP
jgi:hypothetical protein